MPSKNAIFFLNVIFSINLQIVLSDVFSSHWESYSEDGFPPMYQRENYFDCIRRKGTFCNVAAIISANDQNSTIATEIKKSEHSPNRFARSKIIRLKCFPESPKDKNKFRDIVRKKVGEDLKPYNVSLVGDPDYLCSKDKKLDNNDWIFILILVGFHLLIIKGTMYDIGRKKQPDSPPSKYDKWLRIFSVQENWNKVISENMNPDFQKLKSVQGIRVITIMLVILIHSIIILFVRVYENPQDLEQIWTHGLNKIGQLAAFVIQTNFLISAFLLTNHIYEIHKKFGYFSLMHCLKLFVNRIFRFLPTIAILILMSMPSIKFVPQGHLLMDEVDDINKKCASSWWMTLLQLNMFNGFEDMCHRGTWYLSTDTFFYMTILLLLYVQLKFKLDIKRTIGVAFLATTLNYGYIIYSNNLDIIFRLSPNSLRLLSRDLGSVRGEKLYISPFSSWNTSCLGVALGAIYFHTKNKQMKINIVMEKIWLVMFLCLPILSTYLSTYKYEGVSRAIVGPLLKPLYALGYGIGILGMAHGLGGIVKKFLECNFFEKMGNFTYCTYLYHFYLVCARPVLYNNGLYSFRNIDVVTNMIQDIIISFIAGIITTVLWEYPGLRLQKLILPQIEKFQEKKTEFDGEEEKTK